MALGQRTAAGIMAPPCVRVASGERSEDGHGVIVTTLKILSARWLPFAGHISKNMAVKRPCRTRMAAKHVSSETPPAHQAPFVGHRWSSTMFDGHISKNMAVKWN